MKRNELRRQNTAWRFMPLPAEPLRAKSIVLQCLFIPHIKTHRRVARRRISQRPSSITCSIQVSDTPLGPVGTGSASRNLDRNALRGDGDAGVLGDVQADRLDVMRTSA